MGKRVQTTIFNIFIISILHSPAIFAKPTKILPEFDGFWYTKAHELPTSICESNKFEYTNRSPDISSLSGKLFNDLPQHSTCEWSKPEIKDYGPTYTEEFPGTWEDLDKVAKGKEFVWYSGCIGKNGPGLPEDTKIYHLYPSFSCPKGTKYFIESDSEDSPKSGCYKFNEQLSCMDVIGRDLSTTIPILKGMGHIAIIGPHAIFKPSQSDEFSSSVIEVLDEEPVIQVNTLVNFKQRVEGGYWGAKFDLPDFPQLKPEEEMGIVKTAVEQMGNFPEYTMSWKWWPGKTIETYYVYDTSQTNWVKIQVLKSARFRCDSFIYYLFSNGANRNIPYQGFMTPKGLFAEFKQKRENADLTLSDFGLRAIANRMHEIRFGRFQDYEYKIQTIFDKEYLDILEADIATNSYMNEESITRNQKIKFLWSLAKKYELDNLKLEYILDIMNDLKPTELFNDLVNLYNFTQSDKIKIKLLSLMTNSVRYNSLDDVKDFSPEKINDIIKIQEFIKEKSTTGVKKKISNRALLNYSTIVSPSIAYEQWKTLYHYNAYNNKFINGALLNVIFANDQAIQNFLPKIINKHDLVNNNEFYLQLCAKVKNYPVSDFPLDTIKMLARYLVKSNNYQATAKDKKIDPRSCDLDQIMVKLKPYLYQRKS